MASSVYPTVVLRLSKPYRPVQLLGYCVVLRTPQRPLVDQVCLKPARPRAPVHPPSQVPTPTYMCDPPRLSPPHPTKNRVQLLTQIVFPPPSPFAGSGSSTYIVLRLFYGCFLWFQRRGPRERAAFAACGAAGNVLASGWASCLAPRKCVDPQCAARNMEDGFDLGLVQLTCGCEVLLTTQPVYRVIGVWQQPVQD